jgi:hypothetical protein
MANLIMHDSFEPYYAGREKAGEERAKSLAGKPAKRKGETEIVLPSDTPPAGNRAAVNRPDRRRPTAH